MIHAQALIGTALGNVTLQRVLGQGEFGVVFLARQSPTDPQVVVKVLSPATTQTSIQRAAFLERFRQDINVISSLEHQNILPLFEYGKHDGFAYLVMPYISCGRGLTSPLQLSEIADYLDQLATALDYAHTQGVLHLDLKPNNVLITDEGRLFLTDFGLMKIATERQTSQMRLLRAGTPIGSIDYMAPEQVMGDIVDARTDLYALGVMLYQMVTGKTPFQGTPLQIATQHVQSSPPSPRLLREDVSLAAEQVMLQALAKRPLDRHTSAQDLARAFRAAVTAGEDEPRPYSVPEKRGPFDPTWQKATEDSKLPVASEQSKSKSTGLLSAAGMAAFRPGAPTLVAANDLEKKEPAAQIFKAPNTPLPRARMNLAPTVGFKSGNLRPMDGPDTLPPVETTKESGTSVTAGEDEPRPYSAPLPSPPPAPAQFSSFPSHGQTAHLTKPLSVPGSEQNTTGAMAIPRARMNLAPTETIPRARMNLAPTGSAGTTGALMIPGGEIGANGTVKLKEAVKVVQVPVAGQPGRYVTGFLPVLPRTEQPEESSDAAKAGDHKGPRQHPYISPGRDYKKLLKRVALPLLALLILTSSGLFWFVHTRPTVTPKSGVRTEKLKPDLTAIAAVQATATANANYILIDPLQQNIHNWPIAESGYKTYMFNNGAYDVTDNDAKQSAPALLPEVILSRPLVYTLTMQEIKGNDSSINNSVGMILFLNTQAKHGKQVITFYSFEVVNNKGGVYQFLKYDSSKGQTPYVTIWQHTFGGEFHQGHSSSSRNTIKVVVNGKYFTFWVNGKKVGSAQDSSIGSGQIGMLVNLKGTEVAFSNLQLTYN